MNQEPNVVCLQHWSKLEPCPVTKSDHAAVCLGYGCNNPQLFVTGGREALSDAWILNLTSGKWRKVRKWVAYLPDMIFRP